MFDDVQQKIAFNHAMGMMFVRGLRDHLAESETGLLKEGRELTPAARKRLPGSAFVYPKERKYPIHDEVHGRNALARVSAFGTPAEKKKVRAAVYAKYPGLKERKEERGEKVSSDVWGLMKDALAKESPEPSTKAEAKTAGVGAVQTFLERF